MISHIHTMIPTQICVAAIIIAVTTPASAAEAAPGSPPETYIPVRPKPPYRLWYQPPLGQVYPELYKHISFVNSIGSPEEARYWNERGVAVGRWAYGPWSPHVPPEGRLEYFLREYNPTHVSDWRMPGVGLYGRLTGDHEEIKALIQYAERLTNLYYGDDVLFIDGFENGTLNEGGWRARGPATVRSTFDWSFPYDNVVHPINRRGNMTEGDPVRVALQDSGPVVVDVTSLVKSALADSGEEGRISLFLRLETPTEGPPDPTPCSVRFYGLTSPEQAVRPALVLEPGLPGPDGASTNQPAVLGALTARGQRPFNEPGLDWVQVGSGYQHARKQAGNATHRHAKGCNWHYPAGAADRPVTGTVFPSLYYTPWWDEGAINVRFHFPGITPDEVQRIGTANLLLHAVSVDNPAGFPLAVSRVPNTAPQRGYDVAKATRLRAGASLTRPVSTSGRKAIRLNYQYKTSGLQNGDRLVIEWTGGTEWHTIREVSYDGGFHPVADQLPVEAAGQDRFALRFRLTGSEQAEAYIDLVRLTGRKSSE